MKVNNFPQNLKMLRKQYSMSMDELGNHINVSKQTISKYEKGLIEPNFHTLVSISTVFDCSLDNLIFGNVEKNTDSSTMNLIDIKDLINKEFNSLQKELYKNFKQKFYEYLKQELYDNFTLEINDTKSQIFESIDSLYKTQNFKSED